MFNIGFDCNTADLAATLKKYPLIAGSLAYLLAVLVTLIKKKGAELTVKLDGEVCHDGKLLLCALANGICCGGGIKSSPDAVIDDGLMDVNVIYNISRGNFLKKFPYYSKGTHRQLPDIDEILLYKRCQKAVIMPKNGTMRLCADGEIVSAGEITFEMVPHAFRMIIPAQ